MFLHSPEICAGSSKLIRGISLRYPTFYSSLTPFSKRLIFIWNLASNCGVSPKQPYILGNALPGEVATHPSDIALHRNCYSAACHSPQFEAVNMSDRSTQIAAVTIALYTLSLVAVSVRCYVRVCLTRSFGYDDWLIVTTLVRLQSKAFERSVC